MMISGKVFVFVVVLGVALAYTPGEYVPRSFYVIDQFGHQSAPVFIRNRREIMPEHPIFRVRRGSGYSSASSHASASANSGSSSGGDGGGPIYYGGDYVPNINHDPAGIIGQVQNLLNNIPTGGPSGSGAGAGGAHSFASSSSSASAGTGGSGPATGQSYGGLGSGQQAGYSGPTLFSRFGEDAGQGVSVSGSAQGQHGAFSKTSSSSKDGKVSYSVESGKY